MNVVIRADASSLIGSGHVMRCLTLASAWREAGGSVFFVCRDHQGHLGHVIEARGFPIAMLPRPKSELESGVDAYAPWLGASWEEDAAQTCAAIQSAQVSPDWLIVDHYAIDLRWQRILRSWTKRIMVIDDLANRAHDCSLLLDQNLVAQIHDRYSDKVPKGCRMLLGPQNALLQPGYAELHERLSPRQGPIRRIFIFFGGSDLDNLTGRSLCAFLSLERPDIEVDIVIGSASPNAVAVREQAARHGNLRVHDSLPTLAPLMAKADLAIGASGATNWERLCLGLPTIVVSLADNQVPVAAYLHEMGLVHWIGHKDRISEQTIAQALARVLDLNSIKDWSSRCSRVCSGRGTSLVLDAMTTMVDGAVS